MRGTGKRGTDFILVFPTWFSALCVVLELEETARDVVLQQSTLPVTTLAWVTHIHFIKIIKITFWKSAWEKGIWVWATKVENGLMLAGLTLGYDSGHSWARCEPSQEPVSACRLCERESELMTLWVQAHACLPPLWCTGISFLFSSYSFYFDFLRFTVQGLPKTNPPSIDTKLVSGETT